MTRHLHLVTVADADLAARTADVIARYKASEYSTMMAIANAPITVTCAFCKATRGNTCTTSNGYNYAGGYHAPRKRAVANLSDDEALAAYAAYEAGLEQRRDVPLPVLTPEQLATRAAIDKAFAKVEAEVRAKECEMRARCRAPYIHRKDCTCRTETEEQR